MLAGWKAKGELHFLAGNEEQYLEKVVEALRSSTATMVNLIYEARSGNWNGGGMRIVRVGMGGQKRRRLWLFCPLTVG